MRLMQRKEHAPNANTFNKSRGSRSVTVLVDQQHFPLETNSPQPHIMNTIILLKLRTILSLYWFVSVRNGLM